MTDDAPTQTTTDPYHTHSGPQRTSLSKGWVIKSLIIILVFLGLAAWGYYDATVAYVKRGQNHVDAARLEYLTKAIDAGRTRDRASIEDPAARLAELERRFSEYEAAGRAPTELEAATRVWLTALDRLHDLEALARENREELARREAGETPRATRTVFVDPVAHRRELAEARRNAPQPKPLTRWDIPVQWSFVVVGLAGGIPLLLLFLVNASKSYRYDPATRTLTLPGGTELTPENLESFDKRKWDKFLVFIRLAGETEERKIDLYRYTPLEDWLVEIYEASPIYEPEPEPEPEPAAPAPTDDGDPPPGGPDTGLGEDDDPAPRV